MKQLIFMVIVTLFGTVGVVFRPFWGVAVYYLFAMLRPEFLWKWVPLPECPVVALRRDRDHRRQLLPHRWASSPYVPPGVERIRRKFGRSQLLIALFASWIFVTYFTARNQDQAFDYFIEYIKIFAMMAVSMVLLCHL